MAREMQEFRVPRASQEKQVFQDRRDSSAPEVSDQDKSWDFRVGLGSADVAGSFTGRVSTVAGCELA